MRRLTESELETALTDLSTRVRTPELPYLAQRVRARIGEAERPRSRSWLFSLAPAVLTLLVLGAGAAATEMVRLHGVDIFRVPAVTAVPVRDLDLGERTTLESARALLQLRIPTDSLLARPDEVYVEKDPVRVAFVYHPRPGLRPGPTGHGALVTQQRALLDTSIIGKGLGPNTVWQRVTVGGEPAVWIEGEAHLFFYRDEQGNVRDDSLRLAGNTLLWQRGDTLFRLEAQLGRERALRIAESFTPAR